MYWYFNQNHFRNIFTNNIEKDKENQKQRKRQFQWGSWGTDFYIFYGFNKIKIALAIKRLVHKKLIKTRKALLKFANTKENVLFLHQFLDNI